MAINIEEVKKYNAALREQQERSAKLRAELEFSEKELARQCKELSAELGVEVTPDNIKEILDEHVEKIKNTMSVGTEILERIKAEEKQVEQANMIPPQPSVGISNIGMKAEEQRLDPPSIPNFGSISGDLPPIFGNGQIKI